MMRIRRFVRPADRRDDGASAVEYSFIVAAIAAILVLVIFAVGHFTGAAYSDTCSSLAAGDFNTSQSCP
jgi:Flp pilus assembly pilin Flp